MTITEPRKENIVILYLIQVLDQKTTLFSTIFRFYLSHNHNHKIKILLKTRPFFFYPKLGLSKITMFSFLGLVIIIMYLKLSDGHGFWSNCSSILQITLCNNIETRLPFRQINSCLQQPKPKAFFAGLSVSHLFLPYPRKISFSRDEPYARYDA